MRMIRVGCGRLLALFAVLGVSAGLLVAVGASSAAAAVPQQFYGIHWNIAGATTHDGDPDKPNNYGSTLVTERLAHFAAIWRPSVISVNEACDGQVDALRGHLEDVDEGHPVRTRPRRTQEPSQCARSVAGGRPSRCQWNVA